MKTQINSSKHWLHLTPLAVGLAILSASSRPVGAQENPPGGSETTAVVAKDARTLPAWGVMVDPVGDCSIKVTKTGLTITVPGTVHDLSANYPAPAGQGAPRVLQDVEGDFTVQVKVSGKFDPGDQPAVAGNSAFNGAGLLVWEGDGHYLRVERNIWSWGRGTRASYKPLCEYWEGGRQVSGTSGGPDTSSNSDCTYLRLSRHGQEIRVAISANSVDWAEQKPIASRFAGKVRVGVSAINTSKESFTVAFSEFKLSPLDVGSRLGAGLASTATAQVEKPKGHGRLHYVGSVTRDDLHSVSHVRVSSDGKFLYAAAWQAGAIVVFRLDQSSGHLSHVQTLSDKSNLAGDTGIEISPAGNYAVAAAFQARTIVLMKRDAESGKLEVLDVARQNEKQVTGLEFPVQATFSLDSRHVYVLDGEPGGVTAFRLSDDKLHWLETSTGQYPNLQGSRAIALHPDGKAFFLANYGAGTLAVLERNPATGQASVKQFLQDEPGGAHGLSGAFGVVCSRDGQFIYVVSGRFKGDNAVSVFQYGVSGKLALAQELLADHGELGDFKGGHYIILSPDGLNVYTTAFQSSSVACLERNPQTGLLKHLETLVDKEGQNVLAGAAGVSLSPDGKFVYLAAENKNSISIFRRE